MEKVIDYLKKNPFSGSDILEATDNKTTIVRYRDICRYRTIEELLNPFGCIVILYETQEKYGHWVCVILHQNGVLEFFDPYGKSIDDQLKYIDKDFAKQTNQDYPFLGRLMLNSPYNLVQNKVKLQKFEKNNSSCGRHNAFRIAMRNLSLKEYQNLMKKEKGLDSDDKVTYLTGFVK